ncbi:MAG TPA: hypothetical protein VKA48_03810 [Gammaproteobacteria bacterium]|nr:hypothetical protein [Gammaproteobacteria bacterium]
MSSGDWLDKFPLLGLIAQPTRDWPRALRTGVATALGVVLAATLAWPASRAVNFFDDLDTRANQNMAQIQDTQARVDRLQRRANRIEENQEEVGSQLDKLNASLDRLNTRLQVTNAILTRMENRQDGRDPRP